jgi:hypothetical protein
LRWCVQMWRLFLEKTTAATRTEGDPRRRFEPRGNPYGSSWYKQLNDPRCWDVESTRWLSWRRRFLLPRDAFRELMLKIIHIFPTPTLDEYDRCIDNVVFRNVVCPVELKVMGLLRQMRGTSSRLGTTGACSGRRGLRT